MITFYKTMKWSLNTTSYDVHSNILFTYFFKTKNLHKYRINFKNSLKISKNSLHLHTHVQFTQIHTYRFIRYLTVYTSYLRIIDTIVYPKLTIINATIIRSSIKWYNSAYISLMSSWKWKWKWKWNIIKVNKKKYSMVKRFLVKWLT